MNITILEEKKNKLVLEVSGEDHTLCNVLVKKLNSQKDVKHAVYAIDHPLVGIPRVMIEAKDAKDALKKAISELRDECKSFEKLASSL